MDSPFHIIDTIRMGQLNKHCKGSYIFFLNYDVFLSLNGVLIWTNSAVPDEKQLNAAFYRGYQCLPKYQFSGFHYTIG